MPFLRAVKSPIPDPASRPPSRDFGYCELSFRPDAKLVSVIRRFVTDFYEQMLQDRDGIDRVALATHELLENAVKYSSDGETTVRIQIELVGSQAVVNIRTRNKADAAHAQTLREILAELDSARDPFDLYQEIMRRSLLQGDGSRLGLARLRAEADMRVSLESSPSDEINLLAVTVVASEATP